MPNLNRAPCRAADRQRLIVRGRGNEDLSRVRVLGRVRCASEIVCMSDAFSRLGVIRFGNCKISTQLGCPLCNLDNDVVVRCGKIRRNIGERVTVSTPRRRQ